MTDIVTDEARRAVQDRLQRSGESVLECQARQVDVLHRGFDLLPQLIFEVETLRTAIYKWQLPANQHKLPTEFLTEPEKIVVRRAVSENI